MNVTVRLFAAVRDIAGVSSASVEVPVNSTAGAVMDALIVTYPEMKRWKPYVRFAVNREYVSEETILTASDEIAIIPPVSGG